MRTTHLIVRKLEDVATRGLIPDIEGASFLLYAEPDGSLFAIRLSNVEIPTADERACLRLQNGQQRQSKSDETYGTKHARSLTHVPIHGVRRTAMFERSARTGGGLVLVLLIGASSVLEWP